MVLRLPLEILCQICSWIPTTDVIQLCRASPKLAQVIYSMPQLWREITIVMQPITNSVPSAINMKPTKKVDEIPDRLAQHLLSTLLSRDAKNGIKSVKIIDHAKFFFQQDDFRTQEMLQLVFRQCSNIVHFTLQSSSDIDYYTLIDSLNELSPTCSVSPSPEYQLPRLTKFELVETHRPRPMLNHMVLSQLQRALSHLSPHSSFSLDACKECKEYMGYQQPLCAHCFTTQADAIRCPFCHWQCDDCGAHFCDVCQKKELVEVLLADYHQRDATPYDSTTCINAIAAATCNVSACPTGNTLNGNTASTTTLLCSNCVRSHKCNRCNMLFASENLRHCDICQQQSFCSSVSDESLTIPEPTRSLPLTPVHTIYRELPLATSGHASGHPVDDDSSDDEEDDDDSNDLGCCRFSDKFIRCKQCKMSGFCTSCLPQARAGVRNWVTVCPTCDEFICPLCVAEGRLPLFFAPGYGTVKSTATVT